MPGERGVAHTLGRPVELRTCGSASTLMLHGTGGRQVNAGRSLADAAFLVQQSHDWRETPFGVPSCVHSFTRSRVAVKVIQALLKNACPQFSSRDRHTKPVGSHQKE